MDEMREPGLPIRDCARGCNNCVHTRAQMSAIDVTKKILFERLYLVSGIGTIGPFERLYLFSGKSHNSDWSLHNYFSIFVKRFSPNGP